MSGRVAQVRAIPQRLRSLVRRANASDQKAILSVRFFRGCDCGSRSAFVVRKPDRVSAEREFLQEFYSWFWFPDEFFGTQRTRRDEYAAGPALRRTVRRKDRQRASCRFRRERLP